MIALLCLLLAFLAGGVAATWAWTFLVLASAHRKISRPAGQAAAPGQEDLRS